MAANVVQFSNNSPAGNGGTITAALSGTVAGNSLCVFMVGNTGLGAHSPMADTQGNVFTKQDDILLAGLLRLTSWTAPNIIGGVGANTVTGTYANGTSGNRGMWLAEIGGIVASPVDGHAANPQALPTTATDATVSGTASNAVQPALIVSICVQCFFNSIPGVGSGFSNIDSASAWGSGLSSSGYRTESKYITSTGSQQATYTVTHNANVLTAMVMFDEGVITAPPDLIYSGLKRIFIQDEWY